MVRKRNQKGPFLVNSLLFSELSILLSPGYLSAFNPTNIAGCVLWLRADLGVTTSGSDVIRWVDQVGGVAFDQSAGPDYPQLVLSSNLNNKAAIDYIPVVAGGSGDNLFASTVPGFPNLTDATIFYVMDSDNSANNTQHILRGGTSGLQGIVYHKENNFVEYYDGTLHRISTAVAVTGAQHMSLTLDASGGTGQFRRGGTAIGGSLVYDGTFLTGASSSALGVGCNHAGGGNFDGRIAEVAIYNNIVSDENRILIESYFNNRYGL